MKPLFYLKIFLVTTLTCLFNLSKAQIFDGTENVITDSLETSDGPQSVFSADLDGDGDMDVLFTSRFDNKIAWYKNDGSGNFGVQQIISVSVKFAEQVIAVDLDGDKDLDILSMCSNNGLNKIIWYENQGFGNFGEQQIITTDIKFTKSIFAADIDGDGLNDVLSASVYDNKIAWYRNNGAGNFGEQQIISIDAKEAQSVFATDIDGDGDMDVLSASHSDNKIAWYQNDGEGNFGEQKIISLSGRNPTSVYAVDLDGDGDVDVLSSDYTDDKIVWYENDGMGNFSVQQIISTNAMGAQDIYTTDIDNDGDMDVLSASNFDDKIAWYKNDGVGNFGTELIISNNNDLAQSVFAADLDGDGDMDVLSASSGDDKIAWYENKSVVGINENKNAPKHINWTNTSNGLSLQSLSKTESKIEIYNSQGQLVVKQSLVPNANKTLRFTSGVYILKVKNDNEYSIVKAIVE